MSQDQEKSRDFQRNLGNSVEMEGHMNAWDIRREAAIPLWQEKIKACRSSGMSVRDWCAENNITRQTYYAWEKYCLSRASEVRLAEGAGVSQEMNALVRIDPGLLPSNKENHTTPISTASAELVIRCGCVRMDISPQMPVARIAELVSALNSHV